MLTVGSGLEGVALAELGRQHPWSRERSSRGLGVAAVLSHPLHPGSSGPALGAHTCLRHSHR